MIIQRIAFAFAAVFLAGNLAAQQSGDIFNRLDANKDGGLSREELPERMRANFDRVDTDGNGTISKAEDAAFRQRRADAGARPKLEGYDLRKDIDYVGDGNPRQKLDLLLPTADKGGEKPPLLVFIHGGAWKNGSKETGLGRLSAILRQNGFAGATINYRLTDEAIWPAQIHDCKAAIRFLRANAEKFGYDGDRIGVWGTSAGGHLVAMLGTSGGVADLEGDLGEFDATSSRVQAVVDYFGPSEMLTMGDHDSTMDHNSPDSPESRLVGGAVQENKDKARSASPVTHVSKDDPPHLIVHGDRDPLVPFQQSQKLDSLLDELGVSSTLIKVVGGGHGNGFDERILGEKIGTFLKNAFEGKPIGLEDGEIAATKK